MSSKQKKSKNTKGPKSGYRCAGKALANKMLGAKMNFIGSKINGGGILRTGQPFDDESIKSFSQWKWHWGVEMEDDLSNEAGEVITVKSNTRPRKALDLFELEDELKNHLIITVMGNPGYKPVGKRWTAKILKSPI